MRLAVVLMALAAISVHGGERSRNRLNNRSRMLFADISAATESAPSFVLDFTAPSSRSDRLPACTVAENCVAICYTGAVTGSTTAWECASPAGAAVGTVTDPGGATIRNSFIPGLLAREIDGATAPSWVSAAIDTGLFGVSTPHTVVIAAMPRTGAPSGLNYYFAGDALVVRGESGLTKCLDFAAAASAGASGLDGWGVVACRWNGTTGYNADINNTTAAVTEGTAHTATSGTYYFGTRAARDFHLNGSLAFAAFYSERKSDTWVAAQQARVWGTYIDAGVLAAGNAQNQGVDNVAATGNADVLFSGARLSSSLDGGARMLVSSRGHTNVWAADALAAATWTDIGTPTVTSNVSSGPFAAFKNAAECDLIVDDDGAAFEGKQSATAGTTIGPYNASCYLKAGTSGTTTTTARISFAAPSGTLSVSACDFTGLASTAARKECRTVVTGSPTSIRASVLVGNAAAETGSIQACQCQLTASVNAEVPEPDNTAHGDTYYTTTTAAWPDPALGGRYEVVHTPLWDPDTEWYSGTTTTNYLFDTSVAADADHSVSLIFGYTVAGRMLAVLRNGGVVGDITINGIGLTRGAMYATATDWRPAGGGTCNVRVLHNICPSGNVATCTATAIIGTSNATICPEQPAKLTLGNRFNGTVPTSAQVHAVRVYR